MRKFLLAAFVAVVLVVITAPAFAVTCYRIGDVVTCKH